MLRNALIWSAAIVVAILSGLAAMGAITKRHAPELALNLRPVNGFAIETVAAKHVKAEIAKNQGAFPDEIGSALDTLAVNAFLSEPVAPEAVAIIALSKTGIERRQLMKMAFGLSRREPLVTSWMIVDSGARQDVASVLNYYDTILRTSSTSVDMVLPIMVSALANKNSIDPIAVILSQNPPWTSRFWEIVAETSDVLDNAVVLRRQLFQQNEQKNGYRDAALIYALISNNKFTKADELFDLLSSSTDGTNIVRNGKFRTEPKYPPMDWQLFSTGDYGAAIGRNGLNLSTISNSSVLFARQLIKLPKRIVELEIEGSWTGLKDDQIFLDLYCSEDIANKPNKATISFNGGKIKRTINNIENPCLYYWLEIRGRVGQNGDGFDVLLESISIRPRSY